MGDIPRAVQPVLLAANVYGIFSSDPFASKRRDGGKTSGDREKRDTRWVSGREERRGISRF